MERTERDGYVYLTGLWRDGDRVELSLPMDVRLNAANPRVREDLGRAAVTRGPICYCLEQADNGADLHLLRADPGAIDRAAVKRTEIGGREMRLIELPGYRLEQPEKGAPLYADYAPPRETPAVLRFIPYCAWANRGEGEMRVWVRV